MKKQLILLCTLLAIFSADAFSRRRKLQLAEASPVTSFAEQETPQEVSAPQMVSPEAIPNEDKESGAPSDKDAPDSPLEDPTPMDIDSMEIEQDEAIGTPQPESQPKESIKNPPSAPSAQSNKIDKAPTTSKHINEIIQSGQPFRPAPEFAFDIQEKKKDVVRLVERAAKTLREKSLDEACNLFSHTKEFIMGELYIFLYDMTGTCLAHGENTELIWRNLINLQDWVGTPVVKEILNSARSGGGWITYGWNNSTKISYIQQVQKDNITYAIGCGFYPQSKEETVVNLVKGGVALFNQIKASGEPIDWAFSRLSYPRGQFVAGNLYLYALDFEGTIVAQGERPGLINTNSWNYQDSKGKYVNREIVKKLKTSSGGVWVDYYSKRALKKAYAELVTANDGKDYFIACGYYPDADRTKVEDLVRKGYQFMKSHGKSAAIEEFSSRQSDDYRYGDLFLEVYDMKGTVVTHGGNADQIGINMMQAKDEDNHLYMKDIIESATKTGTWTNAKVKGAFQSTYAMKIDLGIDSFIILSSYYPVSKPETMTLLVQSAESYLKDNPREKAFAKFVQVDGSFRRGDLQIFVINHEGLCYAYGDDYDLIWRNLIKLQDDDGRPFIKLIINTAQQGPNFIKVKLNKVDKIIYVAPVEKGGIKYVVGSGYYL